jgi:hypothetical protein
MVTSVNQRDPNNAHANATFPAYALGAPDGFPASLGLNGFIVLDMGAGHEIVNGPGNDFTVTEALFNRDMQPEAYQVFTGTAYVQTTLIGSATGTASFDLAAAGVTSARYLKILDQSGSSPNLPFAGMDLDGITVLNSATQMATEPVVLSPLPEAYSISCSPNPFNPTTVLSFELRVPSQVSLKVYDTAGRLVTTLAGFGESDLQQAGTHEVTFDGSKLASGIYLYTLRAGQNSMTGKMVLMK